MSKKNYLVAFAMGWGLLQGASAEELKKNDRKSPEPSAESSKVPPADISISTLAKDSATLSNGEEKKPAEIEKKAVPMESAAVPAPTKSPRPKRQIPFKSPEKVNPAKPNPPLPLSESTSK